MPSKFLIHKKKKDAEPSKPEKRKREGEAEVSQKKTKVFDLKALEGTDIPFFFFSDNLEF